VTTAGVPDEGPGAIGTAVLSQIERAEERACRIAEIVPGPRQLRARFVYEIVVADDTTLDATDAGSLERLHPRREIVAGSSTD